MCRRFDPAPNHFANSRNSLFICRRNSHFPSEFNRIGFPARFVFIARRFGNAPVPERQNRRFRTMRTCQFWAISTRILFVHRLHDLVQGRGKLTRRHANEN